MNEDTPNLFEFVTLRPRKLRHDSGFPMILVEGMPIGCTDPKSMVVISRGADVIRLQNRGIYIPQGSSRAVPPQYENMEDSITVSDFRCDIWHGRVRMYFRFHYLAADGGSSVDLNRGDVRKK